MSQRDLVRFLNNVANIINNQNFIKAGLTSSGAVSTAKTTTATYYAIAGKLYTMAASTNMTIPPTAAQSTPTYCYYLFSLNSSGALTVTKGAESATSAGASLPAVPASKAPIGSVLVYASATAFTMGTSNMNTAVISAPTWTDLNSVGLSLVNP
jgi:hypothetical protein